ncbi:ead/Ea22-like family protein [Escherichia coli]|nr:ead/Ea22-like family protein [Escherichia coli]MCQ5482539.1 ead/Ea22-like family protein [Escherichia coli]MCQ5522789.1 ead/Ea22-like family protein [Escherichia coli]MCQ5542844.1 ead/Ea22-like family protein [Escherichia coli]MCQ5554410.1 ead/Ea22-like family protein [Escherichia coli]
MSKIHNPVVLINKPDNNVRVVAVTEGSQNYQDARLMASMELDITGDGADTWSRVGYYMAAEIEALRQRIVELETNLAALAVENVGIKSAIPEPRDIEDDNDNMDDVSLAEDFGFNHAIERMRRRIPETPATDAFLAEVRAQGVEMFSEKFGGGTPLSNMVKEVAADFAAKLRKGGE